MADTSSLEAFREFPQWKDKSGQDLALAVWKYFVGTETGVFHYRPICEGTDPVDWEFRMIRDPIKMINTYGYGFCGAFGPTTADLFEAMGFEQARAVQIPGSNHSVTEVWYDGKWHYFDTDLRGVIFQRDGKTIASVQDTIDQPDLWTNPSRKMEPFFPDDPDLSTYARNYGAKPIHYVYNWFHNGSTMDYVLRKGESLTRWWRPQGGRWSHQENDAENDWWKNLINKEPYGAKGNHAAFSVWTHGNGLFDYKPVLRKGSGDFEDGVFNNRNIALIDDGLTLESDGEGDAIFEVVSPYVIVPQVSKLDDRSGNSEASVITFTSRGEICVSISLDYGRSYTEIKTVTEAGETSLDLTPYLRERYQYLVKFTLLGQTELTCLQSLRIRTWVQVAPASLPRLKKGVNHLKFKIGDKHGFSTTPWMQIPNMGDREEMSRYWTREPEDYDPERRNHRLKGEMELLFTAPPGRKIKWASLGGYFRSHQHEAAVNTKNELWYALDDSNEWKPAHIANIPTWHGHWHYAHDNEFVFQNPVEKLRVRYVGQPAVNGVRVNIHSLEPGEDPGKNTIVTHGFRMGGKLHEERFEFDGPGDYSIDCPETPEDMLIKLEVPSDFSHD
ncbi:hypothetical protein ACFL6S_22180 [Candidatus Poribacteria bacterium]